MEEEAGRLKLFYFISFPELVTRFLNLFLRPFGWYTHHASSRGDHRRWINRDHEHPRTIALKGHHLRSIGFEHVFLSWNNGLEFRFKMRHDSEDTFSFIFSIPFIYKLYLNFDVGYLAWIEKKVGTYRRAEYGFSLCFFNEFAGGRLYWKHDSHMSDRTETDRIYKSFYWRDIIYGNAEHSRSIIFAKEVHHFIQPAFKSRPASEHYVFIEKVQCRWKYPRFYLSDKVVQYWDFNFETVKDDPRYTPPAFSGKGECGHDLDDDGIYGCSFDVSEYQTLDLAIMGYIIKVEKNRERYG